MFRCDEATAGVRRRTAIAGKDRIDPPESIAAELCHIDQHPPARDWAQAWGAAGALRPWPPEFGA